MNKKATSIVSYCTIIGWFVAFFAGDKANAKFHLNQGLVLGVFSTGIGIAFSVIGFILEAIASLGGVFGVVIGAVSLIVNLISSGISILFAVLMVIGIVNAANDKEVPLPVIGGIELLK